MNGVRLVVSLADVDGNVRTVKRHLEPENLRDEHKPPAAIARQAMHDLVDELFEQANETRVIAEANR